MEKILRKKDVKNLKEYLKKQDKTVVFTNGCFDILHVGHTRYLKNSAKLGDVLVVGLNSDSSVKKIKGDTRPINNENDRAEILTELNFVDYVIIFDEQSPKDILEELLPDIYTKGADYTIETLPEAPVVKKHNIKVEFITLVEGKSTTKVIEKIEKS